MPLAPAAFLLRHLKSARQQASSDISSLELFKFWREKLLLVKVLESTTCDTT